MSPWLRLKKRTREVVNVASSADDHLSRVFDVTVMVLVAGNILAVILESVEALANRYGPFFAVFELLSVAVFTVELVLRVWVAAEDGHRGVSEWRERVRYLLSPMALADIAAIAPFYLSGFFAMDLRFLRFLRLLRVLKLTRYSPGLAVFAEVMRSQRAAFASAFTVLVLMMIFAASAMFVVEHEAQPEAFSSIPASMWWAVATLTTVGYGDVTPITPLGKFMASSIMVVGIGMVALPTSILASGFTELHQRHLRTLEMEADRAAADGVLTDDETTQYNELAEQLGIDPTEAQQIVEAATRSFQALDGEEGICPHCGKGATEA